MSNTEIQVRIDPIPDEDDRNVTRRSKKSRSKHSKFDLLSILIRSEDTEPVSCAYKLAGCSFTDVASKVNSHERECSFSKIKTKDFHNILQDRLKEENTRVKLLENVYPYLSYNDAEFTDLYLTKDEDQDEDAPFVFTSQTFDSLKMSWRVIVQIEDVPDEAENANVSRKHGTFFLYQSGSSAFYNGRNPSHNKIVFLLTDSECTSHNPEPKAFHHEFSQTHKESKHITLPMAQAVVDDLSERHAFQMRVWLFKK
ncbi:Oidioi.mRNA.OKI2018_I69.chr2.g6621.t2.cds [Oikopleura dioica]|uniref:Oidioi.mRNA.OKI2018_I69.chr2.g6621.t2.cds n=1 Tax=Oikopleura dioica TaxID=34765 RepID=A0ABN7T8E4_OIKDI|nr:Oidioi.mRNA.OKI2018_I69.chr2.g6621.t2.cds [Oikopleura dioica]